MLTRWSAVLICGLLSFAGAVFYRALRTASPARIEEINRQRGLYKSLPDFDTALLAAGWLKVVVYGSFATSVALLFVQGWSAFFRPFFAAASVSGATLLAGEALALVIAGHHTGKVFYAFLPAVAALSAVGAAVTRAGTAIAAFVARVSGREPPLGPREAAEESILDAIVEGLHRGALATAEGQMMESIIDFQDAQVSEITTPRTNVVSVLADAGLADALTAAVSCGHSRLPVTHASADNIIGVLHTRDVLKLIGSEDFGRMSVRDVMRPPHFVPETKLVWALIEDFRTTKAHMAVVLDEYGGTAGIVTIEDVLARIVGRIGGPEGGDEAVDVKVVGRGAAVVRGRAQVSEVGEVLNVPIPAGEEYETIAGYVLSETGRIPSPGEVIESGGLVFRIIDADERRVKRMSVEVKAHDQGGRFKAR